MLEGENIKLSGAITDINGKSARNILDTILSGTEIVEAIKEVTGLAWQVPMQSSP